jgi:hypothetical protein
MKPVYSEEKADWHPLWQLMWVLTTPTWIAIAFCFSVTGTRELWFLPAPAVAPAAFFVLFLVPELLSIKTPNDAFPPLTHMIRGYVPDDAAFPAIYILIGSLGGRWFGLPSTRIVGLGFVVAMLGWLTIHFTMSYLNPNPRRGARAAEAGDAPPRRPFDL